MQQQQSVQARCVRKCRCAWFGVWYECRALSKRVKSSGQLVLHAARLLTLRWYLALSYSNSMCRHSSMPTCAAQHTTGAAGATRVNSALHQTGTLDNRPWSVVCAAHRAVAAHAAAAFQSAPHHQPSHSLCRSPAAAGTPPLTSILMGGASSGGMS